MMPARIILVDDEKDVLRTIRLYLESGGFTVEIFDNPVSAIAYFKPAHYDLCIIDIRMPRLSGFELAKKIWQIDPRAKVCFLTAAQDYEREARFVFRSQADYCFLLKPIMLSELLAHVNLRTKKQSDLP